MTHTCESCGLPIDNGAYCQYCVNDQGILQDFETRFARMVQWALRENSALTRAQAEADTLAYMAQMPAWARHPRVRAAMVSADHGT